MNLIQNQTSAFINLFYDQKEWNNSEEISWLLSFYCANFLWQVLYKNNNIFQFREIGATVRS